MADGYSVGQYTGTDNFKRLKRFVNCTLFFSFQPAYMKLLNSMSLYVNDFRSTYELKMSGILGYNNVLSVFNAGSE